MSTYEINELERTKLFAELLDRYLKLETLGDTERLADFVLVDCSFLGDSDARLLAYQTIAKEYVLLRGRGRRVTLKGQAKKYGALFQKRALPLDRPALLKELVKSEVEQIENTRLRKDSLEKLKERFPEIADFFDVTFENWRQRLRSQSASSAASARTSRAPRTLTSITEEYVVSFESGDAAAFGKLGFGGLKDVYLARQVSTNQEVALKILRQAKNSASREQFKSEVLIQTELTHPNIPQILSFDVKKSAPILIERLILGKSWTELMDAQTLEENLDVLVTASRVVAYAHECKHIIHGDLKPSNVMLGESGGRYNEVYVVDWGAAICLDDKDAAQKKLLGTLDYLPPESFSDSPDALSFATDVFMLGGILYRMLNGVAPYERLRKTTNEYQATIAAKNCEFSEISRTRKNQDGVEFINPSELIGIALKALSKNPKERHADAAEFVAALERYRRRAHLDERLRAADDAFREFKRRLFVDGASVPLLTLVEATSEFRFLREEAARSDADDEPSPLFWKTVFAELEARSLLIEQALESQDFGVAETQIETARQLDAYLARFPDAPIVADAVASVDGYLARLKEARERRERERQAERKLVELEARRLAEIKIAKIRELEQTVAPIVAENWRQGEVALRASLDEPELTATAQHLAERSGIFLEAVSPRQTAVESVAFSADEKYVATFGSDFGTTIYRAPSESEPTDGFFLSVARFPFQERSGRQRLVANPAFVAETADEPEFASRFLLCGDDGVVVFLRFDENGATATRQVDFLAPEPPQDRAVWGAPRFATNDAGETRLIVADASGAASFYSFPDGRLLKKFQLCAPVANGAVPILIATPDGQTLFSAGLDGSFKRWSGEGEALETLDLPLSSEVVWPFDWLARTLETSPDGRTLYASDESGQFVVWDVAAKTPIYVGREPLNPAQCKRLGVPESTNFLARIYWLDADRFLTFGFNERWRVWDLSRRDENGVPANVELRDVAAGTGRLIAAIDISPSRRTLAISDRPSCRLQFYDVASGAPIAVSEGVLNAQISAYLPSDRVLVGSDNWTKAVAFDPQTARVATEYAPCSDFAGLTSPYPVDFAVPEAGDQFAIALSSGEIFFFQDGVSQPTGRFENAFAKEKIDVFQTQRSAFSLLADAQHDPALLQAPNVLDDPEFLDALLGGNQVSVYNRPFIAASPDASLLAGKTQSGDEIVLWDWESRRELKRWRSPRFNDLKREEFAAVIKDDPAQSLAMLGDAASMNLTQGLAFLDAETVVEIKGDGSLVYYNVATDAPLARTPAARSRKQAQTSRVTAWQFSTDRKRLALGFNDGLLCVVDLETNETLLSTAEFARRLPCLPEVPDRVPSYDSPAAATGCAWSRDDKLLCVAFKTGRAALLETRGFTLLETIVVGESRNVFRPYFTRAGKLVTIESRGYLKRWDFRPSPEKATFFLENVFWSKEDSSARGSANAYFFLSKNDEFIALDGDKELYSRPDVKGFVRLTAPDATRETFLFLSSCGFLSTFDATGASVETGVDWNRGVPGATPEALATQWEKSLSLASPETELKIQEATDEFLQQFPDGEFPQKEFEEFLAEVGALRRQDPVFQLAFEKETAKKSAGFTCVASSANRRAFAAIGREDGATYVLTTAEADAGWRLIARSQPPQDPFSKFEGLKNPFVKLAFRPDSRELAAITEDGCVTFIPFDAAGDDSEAVVCLGKTFQASDRCAACASSLAYAPSGRFLFQTGIGDRVWIWNVETRSLAQSIALDLYERLRSDSLSIGALAPLRLNGAVDAFVVAGADGVLRFYQYDDATSKFAPVYIVSPKTLNEFLEPSPHLAQRIVLGFPPPLFWNRLRRVTSLTVSDDEKRLYVNSIRTVYSFDLDEIRRNIASLPEYWRTIETESATGLRYSPLDGLRGVERERLVYLAPKLSR